MRPVAALVLLALAAQAQWLNYPTAGIPRNVDGPPNLSAPAPRGPDGKPDLSGIWDVEHNRPCPPDGCGDMMIPLEFLNIGWSLKDGLPFQPWAADLSKTRTAGSGNDDPNTLCVPVGLVKLHTTPLYRKIIQMPGLIAILYERTVTYRQIFTDGRPLPVDPVPAYSGYSVGKWDGDTLVVESAGFKDGIWLDRNGSPLTEAARITERFHRVNFGKMEIELTVDDPTVYTKPWTVKFNHLLAVDTELMDYVCSENERDLKHLPVN
jgi:hypothetical protein